MIELKPEFEPDAGCSLDLDVMGDWLFVKSLFLRKDHMEAWLGARKNEDGHNEVIAPVEVLASGPDGADFIRGQKLLVHSNEGFGGKWAASGTLMVRKSTVVARFPR